VKSFEWTVDKKERKKTFKQVLEKLNNSINKGGNKKLFNFPSFL
jgi:hypothetical protein